MREPLLAGHNVRMGEPLACYNGRLVPAAQLTVPVFDAGFVLGATVSEQLRTFGGRLYRLDEHLDRLWRSLESVEVSPGIGQRELADLAIELTRRNHALLAEGDDLGLAMFVTPGAYAPLAGDAPPEPMVGLHTYPLPFCLWAEKYRTGEHLITSDVRQVPADCWPAHVKCRSRMHYFLADQRARRADPPARALLLDEAGRVVETSTANVLAFYCREGLVSPPRSSILPGISLHAVAELAAGMGIGFHERPLAPTDLHQADEVLLTSTPFAILAVTRIDGRTIGTGRPGPVFHRLLKAWDEAVGVDIAAQAARLARRDKPAAAGPAGRS